MEKIQATFDKIFNGQSPFKESIQSALAESELYGVGKETPGPFSKIMNAILDSVWEGIFPSAETSSLHWPYLAGTLVILIVMYFFKKGQGSKGADGVEKKTRFLDYVFPSSVYGHLSTRVDAYLYLLDRVFYPLWFIPMTVFMVPFIEQKTIGFLQFSLGTSPIFEQNALWLSAYSLLSFLAFDFMFFMTHYILHKTEIGWAFHRVHHSAQVLNPLTRYRQHFLIAPFWGFNILAPLALISGIFSWLLAGSLVKMSLANVTVFSILYSATANFRHHHVELRFPRWLEKWVQSPGMHHTHHSYLEKHWDTNIGQVLSIWDRMFGTLYISERYEETPWGLVENEQKSYTSLKDNLKSPLVEVYKILQRRFRKSPG